MPNQPSNLHPHQSTDISKRTGTFTSYDGTQIYYEVRGPSGQNAKPMFLCYGLACPINHWVHQIKYFSQHYQTIAFDYRGHHFSQTPKNRENLTIDAICQDIKGLADHLGIEHASFLGHSYGVQILFRLIDMYPKLVDNLVLINGFATNPIKGMFGTETVSTVFRLFKEGYRTLPETLSWIWRSAVTHPLAIPFTSAVGGFNLRLTNLKDIETYARGVASMDLEVFMALFEQMMNYDAAPVLERIEVPTLIISGSKDGVTPFSYQEKMHQKIKNSQLMRVPYGSHCTQLDLPDYVNLRIEKFLREIEY